MDRHTELRRHFGGSIVLVGIAIALWSELRAGCPARLPKTDDKAKAFTGV